MNREKLYDLVQDCFVYDKYGKVTFNLFNFTLLFDDYSDKSVKAVFECLTDNQKEYLKNNFTNFKNFLPPSSYISLNKLNDMITCEFKSVKMRPATEEEQKTNPSYAIQHAYEICWKQEIVYVVDNIDYKNIDIKLKNKLLNINGILDIVYKEWLDKDSSEINDQLYDIIKAI